MFYFDSIDFMLNVDSRDHVVNVNTLDLPFNFDRMLI